MSTESNPTQPWKNKTKELWMQEHKQAMEEAEKQQETRRSYYQHLLQEIQEHITDNQSLANFVADLENGLPEIITPEQQDQITGLYQQYVGSELPDYASFNNTERLDSNADTYEALIKKTIDDLDTMPADEWVESVATSLATSHISSAELFSNEQVIEKVKDVCIQQLTDDFLQGMKTIHLFEKLSIISKDILKQPPVPKVVGQKLYETIISTDHAESKKIINILLRNGYTGKEVANLPVFRMFLEKLNSGTVLRTKKLQATSITLTKDDLEVLHFVQWLGQNNIITSSKTNLIIENLHVTGFQELLNEIVPPDNTKTDQ